MRWSYILPRFILLLLIWAFFYFAFDPLLKWGMIKGLQSALEAKVEIRKVKTGFLRPSLEIYGLKAGNSGAEFKNLFEFESLKFRMDGKQLFEKKFIIDEAGIKGLSFDTDRKTSCKIYIPKTEVPEFVKNFIAESRDLASDRVADMKTGISGDIRVETSNLESAKLMRELQEKYDKEYKDVLEKADFSKYDARIKAIDEKYDRVKAQKNFLKQTKEMNSLKKEADLLLKDFKTDKENLSKLVTDGRDAYKGIEEAKKRDVEKAMSLAKIPSMDKGKIASMLIGPDVMGKIEKYWNMANTAVKYIPENPKKKIFQEKKKRGRIVHFIKENNYPRFLMKKLYVDGVLTPENPIEYSGSILNITDQPALYPQPLTAEIKGRKGAASISLKSLARLYEEPMTSETSLRYDGAPVTALSFGNEKSVKVNVQKAVADNSLEVKTVSDRIDGTFRAAFRNAVISSQFNSVAYKPLKESVENSFSKVNAFNVDVGLSGKWNKPDIKMDTDLAQIISDAFRKSFSDQAEKAKKQIQDKVDAAVKEQKDKLDKLLKDRKAEVDTRLKANQEKMDKWGKGLTDKLKESTGIKL